MTKKFFLIMFVILFVCFYLYLSYLWPPFYAQWIEGTSEWDKFLAYIMGGALIYLILLKSLVSIMVSAFGIFLISKLTNIIKRDSSF